MQAVILNSSNLKVKKYVSNLIGDNNKNNISKAQHPRIQV